MNGATIELARYTRDLLNQPEQTVVILGRTNKKRGDTQDLQIAIDIIAPATSISTSEIYDGDAENMEISQLWTAPMTIDFMGSGAYAQAVKFILLNRSQAGYELKKAQGIDIGTVSQIQDLKLLTGEQYSERYQITLSMTYNITIDVPTLRVDTAITNTITN